MAAVDHDWMAQELGMYPNRPQPTVVTTLLNLVRIVQDHTDSDDETVAVILGLIGSGRVRLCGIFAGTRPGAATVGRLLH